MRCTYACDSPEHTMARRKFLAGMAATAAGSMAGGLGVFSQPAAAGQLQKDQKRIVVFYMHGGLSQLESWDPKPGTETGGPFRSIETSVPGIRISELLPNVARQMHHLCLLRGVNTSEDDHGKGAYLMHDRAAADAGRRLPDARGRLRQGDGPRRRRDAGPHRHAPRAAAAAAATTPPTSGPKYSSIHLGEGKPPSTPRGPARSASRWTPPATTSAAGSTSGSSAAAGTAVTEAYTYSYEQALQLMKQKDVFDVTKEPAKDRRYGTAISAGIA